MLNWKTYQALPRLRSYAEALAHWEKTTPIRGDVNGTKPVGRRDQKWLSIYMRDIDKAVCIGSSWNKERPLLAYYPDGRVAIESQIGASCRERIQRIAGINIRRRSNEDWVSATAYVDGEVVVGEYPLKLSRNNSRIVVFLLHDSNTLHNTRPTYLNPVPVYKHLINKQEKAKLTKQYQPFMAYMEAMAKVSAPEPDNSPWSKETRDNPRMPEATVQERKDIGLTTSLRWGANARPEFLTLIDSDEPENWYKAMAWISMGHWRMYLSDAKREVTNILYHQHRDTLFTKVRADAGKFAHDRYAVYFR